MRRGLLASLFPDHAVSSGVRTLVNKMRASCSSGVLSPIFSANSTKNWSHGLLVTKQKTEKSAKDTRAAPAPSLRGSGSEGRENQHQLSSGESVGSSSYSYIVSVKRSGPSSSQKVSPQDFLRLSSARLAPKKKGAGSAQKKSQAGGTTGGASPGKGVGGANHIFNIYRDIPTDHKILEDKEYPAWLFTLDKPEKTYGELAMMFLYGVVSEGNENADVCMYVPPGLRDHQPAAVTTGCLLTPP